MATERKKLPDIDFGPHDPAADKRAEELAFGSTPTSDKPAQVPVSPPSDLEMQSFYEKCWENWGACSDVWPEKLPWWVRRFAREWADSRVQAALAPLRFTECVLRFAVQHDFAVHWIMNANGELIPLADCSDVFFWGTADGEAITPDNFALLGQTVAECDALPTESEKMRLPSVYANELFVARVRKERPQGASYHQYPPVMWLLFDACGPERKCGFGNPKKRPTVEEANDREPRGPSYEELQAALRDMERQRDDLALLVRRLLAKHSPFVEKAAAEYLVREKLTGSVTRAASPPVDGGEGVKNGNR